MTPDSPRTSRGRQALVAAEWLLLAMLIAVFAVWGFAPAWRTMNTDFPNYFLPAVIHHQGMPIDRAYEWRWLQRQKDHQQIDQSLVGFIPNPPLCAAPMLALASLPSLEAKRVWLVFNLVLLALSLGILSRVTQLGLRRLLLLTFLAVLPLRNNFLFGQYYVVVLFLFCLAYFMHTRGRRATSGAVLALAAWFKIFPAFFLILFLRKRNWRAAIFLVLTGIALGLVSILLFGWNVHRVLLVEVLPRALHGDLVGPYVLQWNSFTALCRRFFLAEPELNPQPWLNSIAVYSLAQAFLSTALLFSFLLLTGDDETPEISAWEWSTFAALLLLLSSMPTHYHYCVLIFSAIVAIDFLLRKGALRAAFAAVMLFATACYPLPEFFLLNLQARLLAVSGFYILLLWNVRIRPPKNFQRITIALAGVFFAALTFSNLHSLKERSADFSRRVTSPSFGYGTFTAMKAGSHLLLNEMILDRYGAVSLPDGLVQPMPAPGDVLTIAASAQSPFVYFELTNQRSQIFRLPVSEIGRPGALPEYVAEGEDPAISQDGHWLAFLREDKNRREIWISHDGAPAVPAPIFKQEAQSQSDLLEMAVTNEGNIIASAGNPASWHFVGLRTNSGQLPSLSGIVGPVRYPALSADGKQLAFSRLESGSWHLFVRNLEQGAERQLTAGACNATSPSWEDAQSLLYVTDCGRGFALGAPARVNLNFANP
jgi:Glycosyltransferase family 87/WD40-like Beta Propeller Repeat